MISEIDLIRMIKPNNTSTKYVSLTIFIMLKKELLKQYMTHTIKVISNLQDIHLKVKENISTPTL